MRDAGERGADAVQQLDVAFGDEDGLALGDVEHVGELFVLGAVVEGDEGDAEHGAGVVGEDVIGAVDRHDGHFLAALDAEALEGVGELRDDGEHLLVGDALPTSANLDECLAVRDNSRRDLQEFDCVHGAPGDG